MSCDCNDEITFKSSINKAIEIEEKTKEPYIVYIRNINRKEYFFVRPKKDLNTIEGITEYFLSDGTKKDYKPLNNEIKGLEKKNTVRNKKL